MMRLAVLVTAGTSVFGIHKKPEPVIKLIANSAMNGFQIHHYVDITGHDCSGCDYVGGLRCHFEYRDEFFHRINNCLWPMYDVVDDARGATGKKCFILDKSLADVLDPLVKDMDYRFIGSKSDCIKSMTGLRVASQYPGGVLPGKQTGIYEPTKEMQAQMATNRHALGRDAANVRTAIKQPYVILILRKGADTNRVFDKASEKLLKQAVEDIAGKHGFSVATYKGDESQTDTIGLFAHASGVVGYHGGGYANVLFASKPMCVVEMTTYADIDYSDKTLSRVINLNDGWYLADKDPEAAWKDWTVYGVPLRQIIEANGDEKELKKNSAGGLADAEFLIHRKTITLTENDVSAVASTLDKCL